MALLARLQKEGPHVSCAEPVKTWWVEYGSLVVWKEQGTCFSHHFRCSRTLQRNFAICERSVWSDCVKWSSWMYPIGYGLRVSGRCPSSYVFVEKMLSSQQLCWNENAVWADSLVNSTDAFNNNQVSSSVAVAALVGFSIEQKELQCI